jgi:hypothetical protein
MTFFSLGLFRIIFPQAPENNIGIVLIFFENLRRYSQVNVHQRNQQHGCSNFAAGDNDGSP